MTKIDKIKVTKKASWYSMLYIYVKINSYEFFSASAPETISRISLVMAACLALL
jgi:hypothetical protein